MVSPKKTCGSFMAFHWFSSKPPWFPGADHPQVPCKAELLHHPVGQLGHGRCIGQTDRDQGFRADAGASWSMLGESEAVVSTRCFLRSTRTFQNQMCFCFHVVSDSYDLGFRARCSFIYVGTEGYNDCWGNIDDIMMQNDSATIYIYMSPRQSE